MTGFFTYRNFSLHDTPPLDGRVALITASAGNRIVAHSRDSEITAQLLRYGIEKVFVVARNKNKYMDSKEEWRRRAHITLGKNDSRVEFIKCDLTDILSVQGAARQVKLKTERLHIVICNAGQAVSSQYHRSPQNVESVFAANCLGHHILVILLLSLLRETVRTTSSEARVVVASSSMHQLCRKLDLDLLTLPTNPKPALYDGIWRYGRSKLGDILFTKELSRRLLQAGDTSSKRIYVNAFFPGNIVTEQWNAWNAFLGKLIGSMLRKVFSVIGQSVQDGAATAVYLAASKEVKERDIRGQYFVPIAKPKTASAIANDMELARDLWNWIDAKATETLGSNWQHETDEDRLDKSPRAM
ncbi:short chain dehydrogenase reductase [Aspergillus sclerotialis]|uniref:Short chain dehydrogenase reductase n=1 Tax=Aspergillus sclerotialis TaxID=2070753 RepID=A0A3A2ZP30_9EURO|nr:short chain dehydrogenase reductase [Aspergillus sclerotialis]